MSTSTRKNSVPESAAAAPGGEEFDPAAVDGQPTEGSGVESPEERQAVPEGVDKAAYTEAKSKAYTAAQAELRVKYRDEFNASIKASMKAAGFDWQPKQTAEEKRAEQFKALLAEDPSLAALVQQG